MNVNTYITTNYENKRNWTIGQSKPNSNPILSAVGGLQMNVNAFLQKDYENEPPSGPKKQTQFKPNLSEVKIDAKLL